LGNSTLSFSRREEKKGDKMRIRNETGLPENCYFVEKRRLDLLNEFSLAGEIRRRSNIRTAIGYFAGFDLFNTMYLTQEKRRGTFSKFVSN